MHFIAALCPDTSHCEIPLDYQHISLWLNVRRDDSYTPTKILVEAGTAYHDLTEVRYRYVSI